MSDPSKQTATPKAREKKDPDQDGTLWPALPWRLRVEVEENVLRKAFTQAELASIQARLITELGAPEAKRQGCRSDLVPPTSTGRPVEVPRAKRWKNTTEKVGRIFGEGERTVRERLAVVEAARKDPVKHGPILKAMEETGNVKGSYQALRKHRTIASLTSSVDENWYTPRIYVEAAREVMGGIDLDPASCAVANKTVRATRFFDKEKDGLRQEWSGRLWLNPPYCHRGSPFVAKLLEESDRGRVTAAVVLVNFNSMCASWAWPLWQYAVCVCKGRIDFERPGPAPEYSSNHGSAFVYLGPDWRRFAKVFSRFGVTVRTVADYAPDTDADGDDLADADGPAATAPVLAPLPPAASAGAVEAPNTAVSHNKEVIR